MHATAVTVSQSMPAAAGQLSVRTMASCYSSCMHSLPGPIVAFVLVVLLYRGGSTLGLGGRAPPQIPLLPPSLDSKASWKNVGLYGVRVFSVLENG